MINRSIQEDITFINMYAPNIGAHKYIKQIATDIKGEIENNTVVVRKFKSSLTQMDRSSGKKSIRKHLP